MAQEPLDPTATVSVHTTPEPARTLPPWLPEAVLVLQAGRDGGLLQQIQQGVRVSRGRMGLFEVCDFFLVLIVYAVSGEATLLSLYAAWSPCAALLFALWSRHRVPARCTLSRFLCAMTKEAVEALREGVFADLLCHGLSGPELGGLRDRHGQQHIVVDVDGTRQAARQRQLVHDDAHPRVRRRLAVLCAPGYPGRKRAEAVRTRTTVQQAHTREWLGTFGAAGNGDCFGDLERACQAAVRYLCARGLGPGQGVIRMDGQYGYVRGVETVVRHGLGYLMRSADYRLLADSRVQQLLSGPAGDVFVQLDTGTRREVFDVGVVSWQAGQGSSLCVRTRLVVTRRPLAPGQKPSVGLRVGQSALELFVSDRDEAAFSAKDLLDLYFARGGFEQTLSEEDREQDPDRWTSGHPPGQEAWQVLSQWVWNLRLRLGACAKGHPVRRTLFAEAQAPIAEPPSIPAPPVAAAEIKEKAVAQIAQAKGRGAGKFAGVDFTWAPDGTLRCPAGQPLRPRERGRLGDRLRVRYAARAADCSACSLAPSCRGALASQKQGRRLSVFFAGSPGPEATACASPPCTPPVTLGPAPLLWDDVPATSLRALCRLQLHAHKVDLPAPPPLVSPPLPLTRDQRSHRRLNWLLRLARNASPPLLQPWRVLLFGIPDPITAYLADLRLAPS